MLESPIMNPDSIAELLTDADKIVGAVILESLLAKFDWPIDEEGAFEVLSDFTNAQLLAFSLAVDAMPSNVAQLYLAFPSANLLQTGMDPRFLTAMSAVEVRNEVERDARVVVTAEVESDAAASLADSGRTEAASLKDKSMARLWVDALERQLGQPLGLPERIRFEALVKGLFETRNFSLAKAGNYFQLTLANHFAGDTLLRAAGKSLTALSLPLYEDCFSSLSGAKETQPSAWRDAIRRHQEWEAYLRKREPGRNEPIDPDRYRDHLAALRDEDVPPDISVLNAFETYIESPPDDRLSAEALLLNFDWSVVRRCFELAKKTRPADFVQKTQDALALDGAILTDDDARVLDALKAEGRKSGSAQETYRDFFERHIEAIESAPGSLFLEWEDFVRGKRIECSDFLEGIVSCLQRIVKARDPQKDAYIVLDGKRQQKPSAFAGKNESACLYFARNYASLPEATKRKVRFHPRTLTPRYAQDVLPLLAESLRSKRASSSKQSRILEFQVQVFEVNGPDDETEIATLSLSWEYPIASMLANEVKDLDVIRRHLRSKKSALVACTAAYEAVGRKGVPAPLALDKVIGFSDGGKLVPPLSRCISLALEWKRNLDEAISFRKVNEDEGKALQLIFGSFNLAYSNALESLVDDALATSTAAEVAHGYSQLLLQIQNISHEDTRRRLSKTILQVGTAVVDSSGDRPSVVVVTPWHPLRMEATAARNAQVLDVVKTLLSKDFPPFSDGRIGSLFFKDLSDLFRHPLYPEVSIAYEGNQPGLRVAAQALGSYTLHLPLNTADNGGTTVGEADIRVATDTILEEIEEYLRLQPHERDNLSLLLYDCDSPDLPTEVVRRINNLNAKRKEDQITCQILLMHHEEVRLQQLYQGLVVRSAEAGDDPTEATGDFLARVRVNLTAANKLEGGRRSKPVDLAYCRDLMAAEAQLDWKNVHRETRLAIDLRPHQWSTRMPVSDGDRTVRLQVACPAQTEAGWAYLYSLAIASGKEGDAWSTGKCPVPMRVLDFDSKGVNRIFRQTHDLATWVVSQDELLDRRLLQAQDVKVIRYVQASTHGRNLIISSDARDTLLTNSVDLKLREILPTTVEESTVKEMRRNLINDANRISGGLLLRAARRANNTNELLGTVLSKYIVQSELGNDRLVAWCFLDDFSQWLAKKEGASLADLLILAPTFDVEGKPHLDVVVTEAKFVKHDGLASACLTSKKQLDDTLSQISEALGGSRRMDSDLWLARLSDLLILQLERAPGSPEFDSGRWRRIIRQRECTVRVWGYSHVFVYCPDDVPTSTSTVRGLDVGRAGSEVFALQEVFAPNLVRELLLQQHAADLDGTRRLRSLNGHAWLGDLGRVSQAVLPKPQAEIEMISNFPEEEGQSPTSPPQNAHADSSATRGIRESALVEFLIEQAAENRLDLDSGTTWLAQVAIELRQALTSRGLPARAAEGTLPILTPNAGIIKIQGTKETTVASVETKSPEIYTSTGLKIISAKPEAARISIAIERPERQVLYTEPILLDYLRTYRPETHGEKLLVGIKEEDGLPLLLDPFNQPHTLVAGITGSGKSVLMQNLILSIAATRSPSQAQIYLIDPKFGVDYRPLDELRHVVSGSGGVIDDVTAAIEILEGLVEEMNRRYELFKLAKVPNILAYRRTTGESLPSLWVVHDEFADWMHTPEYRAAVPDIVGRLSVKARAAGIFLVFAAQRPDKDVMPMQLRSQLGNRLILKVDNSGTSEIAVGEKNAGAERLLGRGHMLAKTGDTPSPVYVQVPFFDLERNGDQIVRLINEGLLPLGLSG